MSVAATWCAAAVWSESLRAETESPEPVTYDQVRPVFRKHCVSCHNQDRARGDLNLSFIVWINTGASARAAEVARKRDESAIYRNPAPLEHDYMGEKNCKVPQG